MFQDSSPKVREAIGWVFQQICYNHAECLVYNQENTQKFVGTLVKSLQDLPKISAHCCRAIGHLADSLAPEDREVQRSNQLTPYFEHIAEALMVNAQRADASESTSAVIEASYDAVISLVQSSCDDSNNSLKKMLTAILFSLEQTIVNASVNNEIV